MAYVTKENIMDELEIILKTQWVTMPNPEPGELEPNSETGLIDYPEINITAWAAYVKDGPMEIVLEALAEAIVRRVDEHGLEMGDSTATKMDVQ